MEEQFELRPRWILKFLQWFCPPYLLEEIEGDLHEKFINDSKRFGERKARRKLFWNIVRFFRPGILLRNKYSINLRHMIMFESYFKVMMRNIGRQKVYSIITILGLTVGLTFAMVIGVFVFSELQVNQSLKDVDRLYLVQTEYKGTEGSLPDFFVPAMLGERAVDKYPRVFENCYRFRDRAITVSRDDKHFRIQSMIGDSTLIQMFGFHVTQGNASTALTRPDAIVITEKIALQFFNRVDVVGESLTVSTENNGLQEYLITAVIANLQKKNSVSDFMNMDAQVFLSHANRANFNLGGIDDWNASIITYIKITNGTSAEEATRQLNDVVLEESPESVHQDKNIKLAPINDYYLVTNHQAVQKLIVSLAVIAVFILLLAIANFINITVARSFSRLKEVGVRKVIGGHRRQVVLQFLLEALAFAIFAAILSLLLYEVSHDFFGRQLNIELPSVTEIEPPLWVGIVGGTLLIGLMAGLYPSIYLSATKTTESLKGKFKSVSGTIRFSRGLVAVQFLIAIFIFTVSLIMSQQISYILEADLGYEKSHVLIVSSVPRLWNEEGFNKMDAAKNEFLSSAKIQSVSLSWGAPNFNFSPYSAKFSKSGNPLEEGAVAIVSATDEDYAKVYGLNVTEGEFLFNGKDTRPVNNIVINEAAKKALSLHVGDKVKIEFSDQEFTVTGIVKDFNFESFHKPVQPMIFIHTRDFQAFRYFSFRLAPGNLVQTVGEIEQLWKKIFPNDPFVYNFTDERIEMVYKTELQLKKASVIGSILILIIILTGVLGLVSLSVARRTKEIGIRKVLGASVSNILILISREYVYIMLLSFLAGVPLSYYFGQHWLSNFAYRVNLQWWMFAWPVFLLFCVTILVVVAQSMKNSLSNPTKSLRYE
jgi:putative ABC transport system permease protein